MRPLCLACLCLLWPVGVAAQSPADAALVGGRSTYVVRPGDTLTAIAARHGVDTRTVIELNELVNPRALTAGQQLTIDNHHIAVVDPSASITINIAQRLLMHVDGSRVTAFPIAAGRRSWPTPVGDFTIVNKEIDPVWDVPLSIQREMAGEGRPVITRMEASADNPLGNRWLGLSIPGLGIHGTNAPGSIYGHVTHGCIRMHPEDVIKLYDRVTVGARGKLVYEPVIVAVIDDRIWLEAHPDPYRKAPDAARVVRELIDRHGLTALVDWPSIDRVLHQRRGRAEDVTTVTR